MPSQQMINLLARYGVTTEPALLKALAEEYSEMFLDPGEEPFLPEHMDPVLDQMLEAEYQRIAGGAYDVPEDDEPVELCSCPARIYGGDCAHTIDEEYELTGWNDEMAAAERRAEEQAFWEGL